MHCTVWEDDDEQARSLRVVVSGDVDVLTAPSLAFVLADALRRGPDRLRVDLDGVGVLSAAAITVLLRTATSGAARGIAYEVGDGSRTRRRLLGALGLTDALALRPDNATRSGSNG